MSDLIRELYASAISRGHINDTVLAVALSSSSISGFMYRVKYANDYTAYQDLLSSWVDRLSSKGWTDYVTVAKESLDLYLDDVCKACSGRGNVISAMLEIDCAACDGTGMHVGRVKTHVEEALAILGDMDRDASQKAFYRLYNDSK